MVEDKGPEQTSRDSEVDSHKTDDFPGADDRKSEAGDAETGSSDELGSEEFRSSPVVNKDDDEAIPDIDELVNLDDSGSKSDKFSHLELPAIDDFHEAELHPKLLATIQERGWTKPTLVQSMCLPYTIIKQDLAGFAQTGTGKTGVFLITLGHRFLSEKRAPMPANSKYAKPFAVVLTPTRELAMQVDEESKLLCDPLNIRSLAVFGGMDYEKQARILQSGVDVIVATPGRFKDFYQKKLIDLSGCGLFICDEVDRMFDMGFVDDVEFFLDKLPEDCQKLLFSATTNPKVKELAFEYLNKPAYISANPEDMTPSAITQHAVLCETKHKFKVLLGLLKDHQPKISIIFTNTKLTAQWLHYKLSGNGINTHVITGDLPQRKRVALIKDIKAGEVKCLIATDVASRGLHIADISHVYNFDIPDEAANYVHRIGRTARAGAEGASYSLVCDEYGENFDAVRQLLKKDAPDVQWYDPTYLEIEDKAGNPFEDNFGVKPVPMPERDSRYGRTRSDAGRDDRPKRYDGQQRNKSQTGNPNKPQPPRDHRDRRDGPGGPKKKFAHKGKAPKAFTQSAPPRSAPKSNLPAHPSPQSTGLFSLIKQFFGALFGRGNKKSN
jgi:ATP-dependent RNA helicase RhlB